VTLKWYEDAERFCKGKKALFSSGRNGPNDWEIRRRFFDIYNAVRTAEEPCHIVLSLIQLVRFYQVDSLVMVRFQSPRFFKTQKIAEALQRTRGLALRSRLFPIIFFSQYII